MKKFFLFIAALCCATTINAGDYGYVTIDGIRYAYLLEGSQMAKVVNPSEVDYKNVPVHNSTYTGDVVIPSTIEVGDKIYTVQRIDYYAFYNSTVTTLQLPSTIKKIRETALAGMTSLQSLTCYASYPPQCGDDDWDQTVTTGGFQLPMGLIIYVPEEAIDTYKSRMWWGDDYTDGNGKHHSLGGNHYDFRAIGSENPAASNDCGDNLHWTLSKDSTILAISGSGDMTDYDNGSAPWYKYRSAISYLILPSGITSIGNGAFFRCENIDGVLELPEAVTRIGESAFEDCWQIKFLTLGSNVAEIGDDAFYQCSGLKRILSYAVTPPTISSYGAFGSVNTALPVYVPQGTVEAYKAATGWSQFTNIQEIPSAEGLEELYGENGKTVKYIQDGQLFILRGGKTYTAQGAEVR